MTYTILHPTSLETILSQAIKEYAPVILHNQSKSLLITESLVDNDLKWSHEIKSTVVTNIPMGVCTSHGFWWLKSVPWVIAMEFFRSPLLHNY